MVLHWTAMLILNLFSRITPPKPWFYNVLEVHLMVIFTIRNRESRIFHQWICCFSSLLQSKAKSWVANVISYAKNSPRHYACLLSKYFSNISLSEHIMNLCYHKWQYRSGDNNIGCLQIYERWNSFKVDITTDSKEGLCPSKGLI